MFSHYPSRYTSSPFDSYYYDPYRAAALQQQQRQRQLELEAARREQARLLQARRLRAQEEEARRREAYLEHLRNQQRQYYCQPEEEEEDGEEEQYYQHPFFPFGFAPQPKPQSQRRQPSPPMQQPDRRQSPQQQQQQRRRSASPKSVHIPIDGDDLQSSADPQRQREPRSQSIPINITSTPAPQLSAKDLERRAAAASTIQSHWRTHVIRKRAFSQISAIRDAFTSLQRSFTFPSTVDFVTSPSSLSPSTIDIVPALAYTPSNRPILSYEHSATELLTRLDAVASAGDKDVRRARKGLVNEIEAALRVLEGKKGEAWRALCARARAKEEQRAQIEVESEMPLGQEQAVEEESMGEEDPTSHSGPHSEILVPAVDVAEPTKPQSQSQSPSEPATPSSPATAALSPVPVAIVIDPTPASTSSPASDSDADVVLVDQPSQHTTTLDSEIPAADEMDDVDDDDDWVDASDEAWIDALALPDQDEQDEKDVEMQLDTAPASTLAAAASDGQ